MARPHRPTRPTRRIELALAVIAVLGLVAADNVAQPSTHVSRLASIVSREARLFLRVDDPQAFMRRARRTDIARALSGDEAAFARESLLRLSADLSMFLPPVIMDAIPAMLSRAEGELALSVEGFVAEDGRPRPDVLLVADVAGFETLLEDLLEASYGKVDIEDVVFDHDLPFEVDGRPRVEKHRGADVIRLQISGGSTLVLTTHRGLLLGARRVQRVQVALDRMERPQFGSLADDPAFTRAWGEVDPAPGSLFAYTNLRLLRRDSPFLRADDVRLRGLFVDQLAEYDAGALFLRGVNDRFEARGWLEVGAARRAGLPLLGGDAPFEAPTYVSGDVTASLSFRLDGSRFGDLLAWLNPRVGGLFESDHVVETFQSVTTVQERQELAGLLGGEATLLHPRLIQGRLPTTVAMIRSSNPSRLSALLDRIADRKQLIRAIDSRFGRTYTIAILANLHLARPAFTIRDGWLIGAPNSMALHAVCGPLGADDSPLHRTEEYVAPFDALDRPVDGSRTAVLFLDTPRLGPAASIWLTGVAPRAMLSVDASEAADFLNDLLQLWDDPEVHEALHGTLVVTRSRPLGVRIEAVGP